MKLKSICLSMLVCLSMMFLARVGFAQEVQPLEPAWLRQMYEDGWQKVQEGVLRREVGLGKFETFGYGAEGFQWLTESYRQQLTYFEGKYRESPSAELASLIDRLQDRIDELQDNVLVAPHAESFDGGQVESCTTSFGRPIAEADPLTSTQGVTATASASFHNECPETGSTFAYAYAHAAGGDVIDTVIQEDPENNGTWIDSYATASVAGSLECESKAQASLDVPSLGLFLYAEDTNSDCPDTVSITGPSQISTDYYGPACADVTWTANTVSGRMDYTYEWYIGTALQSETGPTLPRQYCAQNVPVTVKVVARDNTGWSDDATFTTGFTYLDRILVSLNGPATVNTDYYGSPCATVTWTASVSGGHSGFTYKWYIGTNSTVQSTGSTLSKQYCNTSQTVPVKVVVTASDGHSETVSKTTNVVYTPQLTASVSGPATVTADYYTSTCATVTWTASTNGGHPGYTYNWYIGTGTTSQGTGSTFSKQYCTSQSVTVKAVAKDSDGHTATSPSFTTSITIEPIVALIAGPTSVSSSTSCTTVSWTASASGSGHSGFSYKWYIGTTQQATGTTFSKQFCSSGGTSQSVTVKVTATASDGHQNTDTHTTSITFPATALTASISGESEATLWSATACVDLTWGASVSGGTPAYTYSWTIGTSTTVLSTTSTLTKRVCSGGTLNVKLTVRDSASHTANATFTTTVYQETACFAQCP